MSNKYNQSTRKYTKRNFKDLLDIIIPDIYKIEDISLSGQDISVTDSIINSHIAIANNFSSIIQVSSLPGTNLSEIDSISGISKFFIKQNNLTKITPFSFDTKFLQLLNRPLKSFDTSADFRTYIAETFVPMTQLATTSESDALTNNISTLSSLTLESEVSSIHNYLANNLGWFYFLNTSAQGNLDWDPSSYVVESLSNLYLDKSLTTFDGIKGLSKFLWYNTEACSTFQNYIPNIFVSGAADAILEASDGTVATYTSGIQKLENLETLLEIIYSPYKIDEQDFKVKDSFEDYIDSGLLLDDLAPIGPFSKFIEAVGYSLADRTEEIESLKLIYDIQEVEEDGLLRIAELIGWRPKTSNKDKWRQQLRDAVNIYKNIGTLESIQKVVNSFVVGTLLDVSGKAQELWESYIPFIIWYSLSTESPYFKNLNTWTEDKALKAGFDRYDPVSLENNIKMIVDFILLKCNKKYPNLFNFNSSYWPVHKLFKVDSKGKVGELYTVPYEPFFKDFFVLKKTDPAYVTIKNIAYDRGEQKAWDEAFGLGILGEGVYFEGLELPPNVFSLDGTLPYLKPVGDPNFVFNFRDHFRFPIPPFEEVKYYADCSITPDLTNFIISELKCFGVDEDFADSVGLFINNATQFENTELNSLNNEFLFFFSSVQNPPNYLNILSSIGDYEDNPLPLWNGKSSHLFINFDEEDFNYSKSDIESGNQYDLYEISKTTKEFSPAHTIVRNNFNLSASEDVFEIFDTKGQEIVVDKNEVGYLDLTSDSSLETSKYSVSSVLQGYEVSGADVFIRPGSSGLPEFKRSEANDLKDTVFSYNAGLFTNPALTATTVPRTNIRRRNLRNILPIEGYYDRTGFNPPISFDASVLENSNPSSLNILTLGYIPSAASFHPIEDYIQLSGVWNKCEDLNSDRNYFGVDTSNTFPFRGLNQIGSDAKLAYIPSSVDKYVDRSQTDEIIITMHKLLEKKAQIYAKNYIEDFDNSLSVGDSSAFYLNKKWKNIIQSQANKAIQDNLFINSFNDYENFKFGRKFHSLYKDYSKYFGQHVTKDLNETGATVIAHVFSKGLFNCDFDIAGSAATGYIASSLDSASAITKTNTGYFIASSDGDTVVPVNNPFSEGADYHAEFRNPHILSGIEFVDTSGSSPDNKFYIFKVNPISTINYLGKNTFLDNNTVIKFKTQNSFPRLRFDLSSYGERCDKNGNIVSERNYLIPNHDFELRLNCLVGDDLLSELGGGSVGVWIHTQPKNGMFWSWTRDKKWVMSKESDLDLTTVKTKLSHIIQLKQELVDKDYCLKTILNPDLNSGAGLDFIKKEYLKNIKISFNTRNFTIFNNYKEAIKVPEEYYKIDNTVHNDNTNYIIEIFFLKPSSDSKYLLLDSVELQDLTLREGASIPSDYGLETSSRPNLKFLKEEVAYLEKEELRNVLKLFNGISVPRVNYSNNKKYFNPIPSRTLPDSEDCLFEVSGGSRLNYRLSPFWHYYEIADTNLSMVSTKNFSISSITFIN